MTSEQMGKLFQEFSQADASTTRKRCGRGYDNHCTTEIIRGIRRRRSMAACGTRAARADAAHRDRNAFRQG
jgi:hypothetical protein